MTRGIGDPAPLPTEDDDQSSDEETTRIINELIKGQNKLHDRIIDLERKLDHMLVELDTKKTDITKTKWYKGI